MKDPQQVLNVGIVAGEASGDLIGAQLMQALRDLYPNVQFTGVAGPKMRAAGCCALASIDDLSVIGIAGIICKLPKIWRIRKRLIKYFSENPPDVFIGVDFTEFNLSLEYQLRKRGIKTVHYKSPSVWAWRQGRLKTIAKATDLMLALFPFELPIYHERNMPVTFVGHPLADNIPLIADKIAARRALGLAEDAKLVAILPGSRSMEIKYLSKPFLQAAQLCLQKIPELKFIAPMANAKVQQQFSKFIKTIAPELPITLLSGSAQTVMTAADAVLIASGTATFEGMLCKRPMVAAYRLDNLTYYILRLFFTFKMKYFTLPNLLLDEKVVPEFLQQQVKAESLAVELLKYLQNPELTIAVQNKFTAMHEKLRRNANVTAAHAVLELATTS